MAEPLRLRLARVVRPAPPVRYRTIQEIPDRCPRDGCGGLMKPWPDGKLCAQCGRIQYIERRDRGS